jgi:hypothetical protein
MSDTIATERTPQTPLEGLFDRLFLPGRAIFALVIIAIGIETLAIARVVAHPLGPQYHAVSVLPWLPAIPWLAYLFGLIWIACGLGLLSNRTLRTSAIVVGTLIFLCALLIELPIYVSDLSSISLRTVVFEPISIACLAWLMPGPAATPRFLTLLGRYLLAISMIIFGIDHFLALIFIANLLPNWIPWHVFWVAFFGIAFIAAGVSIALNILLRWGAACLGLMFGIWVITLHLPRVLGLYGIPGAPHNPDEWSSLFIAAALWGGLWALAGLRPISNP